MKAFRNVTYTSIAIAGLALAAAAPSAFADSTATQTIAYGPTPTNFYTVDMGSVLQFNPSTGTLQSVTISFTGNISGNFTLTNSGTNASNVDGQTTGTFFLSSTNSGLNSLLNSYNWVSTGITATGTDTNQYLLPGESGAPISANATDTAGYAVSAAYLSLFEGVGNVGPFDLTGKGKISTGSDNGNGNASYNLADQGIVTVVYDYIPGDNPP